MSSRAPKLARAAVLVGVTACNVLTGAGDFTTGPANHALPDGSIEAAPIDALPGFSYRRTVTLTSDAPAALYGRPILIRLPVNFDYTHTKPNGEDLRIRSAAKPAEDLPYYVETWRPGDESWVWVKPPHVPEGTSMLDLFYGNADAKPQTSFEATFPNARRTLGGGEGSFTANGDIDVDWFELSAGDTLTLSPKVPLTIRAERIIIAGTIDGTGCGYAGGEPMQKDGDGPGAGRAGGPSGDGSGGGGYGGAGGRGGTDATDGGGGGPGGVSNGTTEGSDITLGSGGASGNVQGGAGGGAISLFGWRTTVTRAIKMNGVDGKGLADLNAGGGAGGGILVAASFLELGGATLEAKGGAGGPCAAIPNDGGGGGGGGRIKLRSRANGSYVAPTIMTTAFGNGGAGGGTNAPGENGKAGTTDLDASSNYLKGVETSVGPEMSAL